MIEDLEHFEFDFVTLVFFSRSTLICYNWFICLIELPTEVPQHEDVGRDEVVKEDLEVA